MRSILLLVFLSLSARLFAQETATLPVIRSASIVPGTDSVVLRWLAPQEPNGIIQTYEIMRKPFQLDSQFPMPNVPEAWVDGSVLVFKEKVADIQTVRQAYRVKANTGQSGSSTNSEMIHVPIASLSGMFNSCSNEMDLRWFPYAIYKINNQSAIDLDKSKPFNDAIRYEVWGYTDDLASSFDISKSRKLTEQSPETLDVKVKLGDADENKMFYYYVKVFLPAGDTATSALAHETTTIRMLPNYMRIDTVTSIGGDIRLHFDIADNTLALDRSKRVDTFALYRSDVKYRPIEWFYSVNSIPKTYTDSRGLSLGQVYTYRLVAMRCGKPVMQTDTVSNILLYVQPSGRMAQARWTEFINQHVDVTHYTLKRIVPLPERTLLDVSASDGVMDYLDQGTLDSLCFGPRRFCYHLEASNGASVSIAQEQCLTLEPIISMPNAIDPARPDISSDFDCVCCPGGKSTRTRNMFGPVIDMDLSAYKVTLEIFNRSGLRIFSTTKEFDMLFTPFWDGTHNGKQVQEGVYVYGLRMEFKNGFPSQTLRGTVTVVY